MLVLLAALSACMQVEPTYVSRADLDDAHGRGDVAALCAGLRMKDEDTRTAAAEKLKDWNGDASCLCERLVYEERWDAPVLRGLKGAKDAEKVGCAGALLDDPAQPDRAALVASLLPIPAVRPRLVQAAASDADPAVRAAALAAYRSTKDPAEVALLTKGLGEEKDAAVRAAYAGALFGQKDAAQALRDAIAKDPEAAVRAAALTSWQSIKPDDYTAVVCKALAEDAAPEVRAAAATTLRATRDPAQLACLRDRMLAEEPDATVRAALLDALRASPAKEAADTLCDAIPFWVRTYVRDGRPDESVSILRAQNDRDFERSYDCAQAAVRQSSGYTCHGRAYVGAFFKDLGGRASVPNCDGGAPRRAASNEVSFE